MKPIRSARAALLLAATCALPACATARAGTAATPQPAATTVHAPAPARGYTPHRVYDVAAGAFIDFETLTARAAAADVVFFGEQHDHGPTHRMQLALLEGLARRGGATLSMEMFERDVAPLLSGYVAGSLDHAAFLAGARPWPNYFPDYHPLVELARGAGWHAIAANVPRSIASLVAREGLAAIDGLEPARRAYAAAAFECPDDAYRERFLAEMRRHPSGEGESADAEAARLQRYYEAQCVKDETMAEAIVAALHAAAARPVVHVTGAFHVDHGDGVPVRLRRRAPDARTLVISAITADDLDAIDVAAHAARADYLLFLLPEPRAR